MSVSEAIDALKTAFPIEYLLFPGTDAFAKQNSSYISSLQAEIEPACIFRPRNAKDVSSFVTTIIDHGQINVAVRGAGQQPAPGCSNVQGGITIDLAELKEIDFNEADGVVSIGAGQRWGAVYEAAQQRGLGVSGGRSAKGGIAGIALAGGLSFFSSREGFICENVTEYEIVLASGEVVHANKDTHTELWTSLRGGGNNFGTVTRFNVRTFRQGPFWGGSVFYFPDKFPEQSQHLTDELNKPDATPETHMMMSLVFAANFGATMCMNQMYYTNFTESEQPPAVLEPFTSIQPQVDTMNTMKVKTLVEAAQGQSKDAKENVRCAYMNITLKADAQTLKDAAALFTQGIEFVKTVRGIVTALTLQPYPISLPGKSAESEGNSLGLSPSEGPLVSVLFLSYWEKQSDDDNVISTVKATLSKIESDAKAKGTLVPFVFLNYAWTSQDPIGSHGAENKARLQKVAQKYDPTGFFQKGVPGGWKLFDEGS